MIPKIIWQTYKDPFDKLPSYAKEVAQTWKDINPEYKYIYMDDAAIEKFVLTYYGSDWYNIIKNCPIGVMKSDIWRYLIIYKYGGIYIDLDTICTKPLKEWVDHSKSFIICVDDDQITYGQYAFAGSPSSGVLKKIIDNVKYNFKNPDYTNRHFVHYLTGVHVFTNSIKEYFNINNIYEFNSNNNVKNENAFLYEDFSLFHEGGFMKHIAAHIRWDDGQYVQWDEEVKKFLKVNE